MEDQQFMVKSRRVYQKLLKMAEKTFSEEDINQLRAAWELAEPFYLKQPSYLGRPFVFYPLEMALIAAKELRLGVAAITAVLLFEAVRHDALSLKETQKQFGTNVSRILEGLLNIERISVKDLFEAVEEDEETQDTQNEEVRKQLKKTRKMLKRHPDKFNMQIDNFRRMMISLAENINVILLELVIHLFQIRRIEHFPEEERLALSKEVAYIYTPMAHKLGLYNLKSDMEDRALRYIDPAMYFDIQAKLEASKDQRNQYILNFIRPLRKELRKHTIDFKIKWRTKSIASIRGKLLNKNVRFDQIYDIFAIRIILTGNFQNTQEEKAACWKAYSLITDYYRPSTSRLRDWISNPRDNGYESLHTTVQGPEDKWVEVQIRTQRMDEIAEKGGAAHWRYKNLNGANAQESWLEKIRELLENSLTGDLDEDEQARLPAGKGNIFVFTPKGEIKKLPENASVLDFAYAIHSRVGEHCQGARINNKVYSIKHRLRNGDQVEIITSNQQRPKRAWLDYVESSKTKGRIKRYLNAEKNTLAERGKVILRQKFEDFRDELAKNHHEFKDLELTDRLMSRIRQQYNYKSSLNFLADVAEGNIDYELMKKLIRPEEQAEPPQENLNEQVEHITKINDSETLILAEDLGKVDVELAKCCNPIPGDKIFGFVSATKGTKVHKLTCPNAQNLIARYPYRVISARWNRHENEARFLAGLHVICSDKVGVLAHITDIISRDFSMNIGPVQFTPRQDGTYFGDISVYVPEKEALNKLIKRLKRVKGILQVARNG